MVIVAMGVAGAGKTTVGRLLARRLACGFVDADDLHPPANVAKMRRNEPLTDADREPWLDAVADVIAAALATPESIVVACSALKARYRTRLGAGDPQVVVVFLKASPALLKERLAARAGHYAGPALLSSQLASLEEPGGDALTVDAAEPPDAIVSQIIDALGL